MFFNANRFHFLVFISWQFTVFFATQQIFPIFSNYVPKWRCDESEPFGKNCTSYLACKTQVHFEEIAFHSAAIEYDWICDPGAYFASLFAQIQFAGVLCGTFFYGTLSDAFGRRPIALATLTSGIIFTVLSGLAPNWKVLLIVRFFIGLAVGGNIVVVCTFVMELLLPEQRMILRLFSWGNARLMLTSICYFFPGWRKASFVFALISLPALLIVLFFFPESPTWLHNKQKVEDLQRSERKIAKIAGTPYVELDRPAPQKTLRFLTVMKNKTLAKRLMAMWLMWFIAALSSFANDLNSSSLSGNFFFNQLLFALFLSASKVTLVVFDTFRPNFSRRNLHQHAQAVACFLFIVLSVLVMVEYQGIVMVLINVMGAVFIEYTWDACYLCAVEGMPTEMRASALGSCSLMARFGALLSPFLLFLNSVWAPSAYMAVSVLGLFNLTISYFFLVETKGIDLHTVPIHKKSFRQGGHMCKIREETRDI
ncbi:hypothetical protein QR680_011567 [Steinernema hermaphroditum]|uniref:Major facilitator superfamily (MFS) profile domain-containing protein n=1 Tax=Steinernema hermaphroditum TaxID=289476 RepID=A0AA39HYZ7_9BILA|nr:hypothetical protein QR680_011567 [Steinernema hermaphroditum]